jgi:hypothetical protein
MMGERWVMQEALFMDSAANGMSADTWSAAPRF